MSIILNFGGWKKLHEQAQIDQTLVLSNDPVVKEVYKYFTEYLAGKVPYTDETTYLQRNEELLKYVTSTTKDSELKDTIDFFKQKGYATPDDRIKKFQDSLLVKNFLTADDKKSEFGDGIFGVATAKAAIKYLIQQNIQTMKGRGDKWTYGDNKKAFQDIQKGLETGKYELTAKAKQEPTKLSDRPKTTTQQIGVGTQSFK